MFLSLHGGVSFDVSERMTRAERELVSKQALEYLKKKIEASGGDSGGINLENLEDGVVGIARME